MNTGLEKIEKEKIGEEDMPSEISNTESITFKPHGIIGVVIIVISEILMFLKMHPVAVYFTPIAWTGYILFIDALVFKLKGEAFIINRRTEFLLMLPLSVICWVIFEFYNLHLKNWYYVGLPEGISWRLLGYVWAFATIFPAILETSELVDALGIFARLRVRERNINRGRLYFYIAMGAFFLGIPLVLPSTIAKYLFGLVWMGFVFLLDPLNYLLGQRSLFRELENGKIDKLFSLFLAGIICGFLWEFWNYWAATKWVYAVPFLQKPKIFEMPLAGFLGFLPFAVECYAMYYFALFVLKVQDK